MDPITDDLDSATDPARGLLGELVADQDEPPVASVWLARRLRDAGLLWAPHEGDRFVVPGRDMDDIVFMVAPMVVELRSLPTGTLIAFNGTTEWALDSLLAAEALWLPNETDLRLALDDRFVALRRDDSGRHVVEVRVGAATVPFEHPDAVGALGLALLEVLRER